VAGPGGIERARAGRRGASVLRSKWTAPNYAALGVSERWQVALGEARKVCPAFRRRAGKPEYIRVKSMSEVIQPFCESCGREDKPVRECVGCGTVTCADCNKCEEGEAAICPDCAKMAEETISHGRNLEPVESDRNPQP
jgi:hypothetical protein